MKYRKKLVLDNCLDYKPHNLICMFFSSYVFIHSFIDSLFVPPLLGVMHQMKKLSEIDPQAVTPVKPPQPSPSPLSSGSLLSISSSDTSCSTGSAETDRREVTDSSPSLAEGASNNPSDDHDHGAAQM